MQTFHASVSFPGRTAGKNRKVLTVGHFSLNFIRSHFLEIKRKLVRRGWCEGYTIDWNCLCTSMDETYEYIPP